MSRNNEKIIKLIHWNCNHFVLKRELFINFLREEEPGIVLLNEIKLNQEEANHYLKIGGYSTLVKVRKKGAGGVAILVKDGLSFQEETGFSKFKLELLSIKVRVFNFDLHVFSLYNPPGDKDNLFPFELVREISDKCPVFILGGDLNAKSESFGCRSANSHGQALEECLEKFSISLVKNTESTFHRSYMKDGEMYFYDEILDYFMCSSNILHRITNLSVLNESNMLSDHYPLSITADFGWINQIDKPLKRLNFKKADWKKFKTSLENSDIDMNLSIDSICNSVVVNIENAVRESIPLSSPAKFKNELPKEIIELINKKRKIRRNFFKTRDPATKTEINRMRALIRKKIIENRNESWSKFSEKVGRNPLSSKPYWNKLKSFSNKNLQSNKVPNLSVDNVKFETDEEKSLLFSNILKKTFSIDEYEFFDKDHERIKQTVNSSLTETIFQEEIVSVDSNELNEAISSLNMNSAPGEDSIYNVYLKNLPSKYFEILKKLFSRCLTEGYYPSSWKIALITMIPKKTRSENPSDYRPISLTSCLGKLLEKIVKKRFQRFLDENRIIVSYQSGFRRQRSTRDNLFFLTQKIAESFNRNKKLLSLFFDISKAFDKVWHEGLMFKLIQIGTPRYLIRWFKSFLFNRFFLVKIGNYKSPLCPIEAGVPQGSVLSPLLFAVYINDIPTKETSNVAQSLLFADDLVTFFMFNKTGGLEKTANKYLKDLENWLSKWKMKVAASKCNYIIFSKDKAKTRLKLKICGELIPYTDRIKFLGMTFDNRLSFSEHIKEIRAKCVSRLNIIKILANQHWKIKKILLGNIYKALIGSIIDYSFPIINVISEISIKKLQVIQNSAIRSIFKLDYDTGSNILADYEGKLKLMPVKHRLSELNDKFIYNSLNHSNPLIVKLSEEYLRGFSSREKINFSTPLSESYLTLQNYFPNYF